MITVESIFTFISMLVGGGLLGILFKRKKRKAETDAIEADVLEKMREMYVHFIDDFNKRYEDLKKENEKLKERVKELEERIKELTP